MGVGVWGREILRVDSEGFEAGNPPVERGKTEHKCLFRSNVCQVSSGVGAHKLAFRRMQKLETGLAHKNLSCVR